MRERALLGYFQTMYRQLKDSVARSSIADLVRRAVMLLRLQVLCLSNKLPSPPLSHCNYLKKSTVFSPIFNSQGAPKIFHFSRCRSCCAVPPVLFFFGPLIHNHKSERGKGDKISQNVYGCDVNSIHYSLSTPSLFNYVQFCALLTGQDPIKDVRKHATS